MIRTVRGPGSWPLWVLLFVSALACAQSLPPGPTLFDAEWGDLTPFLADIAPELHDEVLALEDSPVYHLVWTFDGPTMLVARQEVRVVNRSEETWDEIWFHLLPNLLGGRLSIELLRANGEEVRGELVDDERLLRVPLSKELAPGQAVVVSLDYRLSIPTSAGSNYGILGYRLGTLSLAHGYALLAVYDSQGWDLDRPPSHGDLVDAESAFFLVEVDAPAALDLATSGRVTSSRVDGTRQEIRVVAGPVRDFYLVGSSELERVEAGVDDIAIRGHAQAVDGSAMREAVEQAQRAVELFGGLYGEYPYRELDIVVISTSALGVEFPGIIALRRELMTPGASLLESTVVHEVAHQWFYGVVGNDQVSEPWLDEALTQYLTLRYYLAVHGTEGYRDFRGELESRWNEVGRRKFPIGAPVAAYSVREYGAVVYGLGPLVLEWLAGLVERPRFDAMLREYVRRHRFALVEGQDFQELAEEHCACSLAPFFEEWIYPPPAR